MNRLNEIEARANAATEGPWDVFMGRIDHPGRSLVAVAYDVAREEDAEFIAHARTDVPTLVAALYEVLDLHRRVVLPTDWQIGRMEDVSICGVCTVEGEPADWPCLTVDAIRRYLGDDL